MTLTPEQKASVASWIAAGDNLSAVQKKLREQFQLSLTYMDVRFLVDDLDLTLKDPEPKADASDVTKAKTTAVKVKIKGVVIEARGTGDAHLELDNYPLVAGKKSKGCNISLGITHAPYERVLAAMAQDKLDLILAGHTHGGQVRLPWFGGSKALTTNCDLENWRASGLSKVNDEPWLNVSAGMGYSPYAPIRLFCPPEVSLITLTA